MIEKRYTFDNKSLLKDNEFWLDGQIATLCNAEEICELLNELNEENENLKNALWEAEMSYINETSDNSLDIEKDVKYLKKEWEREYWNDS